MSKATVTRLLIGSWIAVFAGAILAVAAVWLAVANDVFVMAGPDITDIRGSALAWSLLGVGLIGGLAIVVGLIGGVVSWIGALANTWRLESKAWFVGLLLLGIFNLGFFAMVAYVIAGPDGTSEAAPRGASAPAGA
jgi:hypothetical protein